MLILTCGLHDTFSPPPFSCRFFYHLHSFIFSSSARRLALCVTALLHPWPLNPQQFPEGWRFRPDWAFGVSVTFFLIQGTLRICNAVLLVQGTLRICNALLLIQGTLRICNTVLLIKGTLHIFVRLFYSSKGLYLFVDCFTHQRDFTYICKTVLLIKGTLRICNTVLLIKGILCIYNTV